MNIQRIPLTKINPAPYNPRVDLQPGDPEYESLKRSIEHFGYVEPLVWNKKSGTLISGHQRFKILQSLGLSHAHVSVVELNELDEKALNIALNQIKGHWDEGKLKALFLEFDRESYDATITGFERGEIMKKIEASMEEESEATAKGRHPLMEIQPYEHYDYLLFMFRDVRDFIAVCQQFDVKTVDGSYSTKAKKIGLGRVLDGKRLLGLVAAKKQKGKSA